MADKLTPEMHAIMSEARAAALGVLRKRLRSRDVAPIWATMAALNFRRPAFLTF
jgi:hypothetical protein